MKSILTEQITDTHCAYKFKGPGDCNYLLLPVVGDTEKLDKPMLQIFEMGYRVALIVNYFSP